MSGFTGTCDAPVPAAAPVRSAASVPTAGRSARRFPSGPVRLQRQPAPGDKAGEEQSAAAPAGALRCGCSACSGSGGAAYVDQSTDPVRPRLALGAAGDAFEREAERAAEAALAGAARREGRALPRLQQPAGASGWAPPSVDKVLSTPGMPLEPSVARQMGERFHHDFSHVRIHADSAAARAAREVSAAAFTAGQHIVFGAGRLAVHSGAGRRLMAHELGHTIQQSAPGRDESQPATGRNIRLMRQADGGDAGAPTPARAPELSEEDGASCSNLYRQKLCVFVLGGFGGDRSGVETETEMAGYNTSCRAESGYVGPDVELSLEERAALRRPKCERGSAADQAERVRRKKIEQALDRSCKYMPGAIGEQLRLVMSDPVFLGGLALVVGGYLALWLFPEPVFTKIAAAATTIAILSSGVFTISTIRNLARAWSDLQSDADAAGDDAQLERVAERFGKRIGAVEADLLVFLASLLVGGKLPGPKRLPPAAQALAQGKRTLASARPHGVVIQGPWGRGNAVPSRQAGAGAIRGNLALKITEAPAPAEAIPLRPVAAPQAPTVPVPVKPPLETSARMTSVVPGLGTQPDPGDATKQRPPFVLRLPQQKAPHLGTYRNWIGTLQSDPGYSRGNPAQLEKWHQALRLGGSHAIPRSVYERGHALGFTGAAGERRIRVPDWTRVRSIEMQVDHIVELQVTPAALREAYFNTVDNYELLDASANATAGPLLSSNIREERAKQSAFDPSSAMRVLLFDRVELDGGTAGQHWGAEELQQGKQLDAWEDNNAR